MNTLIEDPAEMLQRLDKQVLNIPLELLDALHTYKTHAFDITVRISFVMLLCILLFGYLFHMPFNTMIMFSLLTTLSCIAIYRFVKTIFYQRCVDAIDAHLERQKQRRDPVSRPL